MNKSLTLTVSICLLLLVSGGCNRTEINEFRKLYGNDVNEPIIDHRDGFTTTQLHKAAAQHDIAVVKYLIHKGAKPDALDSMGMTPLHKAAYSNKDLRVVKYLFPKTPKVKWTTKDGVTLYHCSANNENLAVATFIGREYFYSGNHGDKDGNNVLHWAANNENPYVFSDLFHLLPHSAKGKNNRGDTPLDLAKHNEAILSIIEIEGNDFRYRDEKFRETCIKQAEQARKAAWPKWWQWW